MARSPARPRVMRLVLCLLLVAASLGHGALAAGGDEEMARADAGAPPPRPGGGHHDPPTALLPDPGAGPGASGGTPGPSNATDASPPDPHNTVTLLGGPIPSQNNSTGLTKTQVRHRNRLMKAAATEAERQSIVETYERKRVGALRLLSSSGTLPAVLAPQITIPISKPEAGVNLPVKNLKRQERYRAKKIAACATDEDRQKLLDYFVNWDAGVRKVGTTDVAPVPGAGAAQLAPNRPQAGHCGPGPARKRYAPPARPRKRRLLANSSDSEHEHPAMAPSTDDGDVEPAPESDNVVPPGTTIYPFSDSLWPRKWRLKRPSFGTPP